MNVKDQICCPASCSTDLYISDLLNTHKQIPVYLESGAKRGSIRIEVYREDFVARVQQVIVAASGSLELGVPWTVELQQEAVSTVRYQEIKG